MLTIRIKAYCVNIVVDIKPIYLNKHYLFQNKICYLDKIYFCFELNWTYSELNIIYKTFQHCFFRVKFAKSLRIPILKDICERLLLYFQHNSHHHFHYHHFHYHRKMRLYRLRILLPFLLIVIWSRLFQLILSSFFRHIFFSSLIPSFSFFTPSKRTQNSFTTTRKILDVLFILIFISMVIYTSLFTLNCLYLCTLTYLYLCSLYTIIWNL